MKIFLSPNSSFPEQKILSRSGSRTCTTLSNKCARSSVSIPSSRWTQNFRESSPDQLENLTRLLTTNIRFVSALTVSVASWRNYQNRDHKNYFFLFYDSLFQLEILTPASKVTNLLASLISLKVAGQSEAIIVEISRIFICDAELRK